MTEPRITIDGWLEWDAPNVTLTKKRERESHRITPEVIVIHYGVTRSLPELAAAQRATGYWAHLSIDGGTNAGGATYELFQALPFHEQGSHAGQSNYRGTSGVNAFSVGIEISNPGPLIIGADGKLRTVHGHEWPEDEAVEAEHAGGRAPRNWTHWAQYTDQEIDILVGIIAALKQRYPSIVDVVGHDEIAPGRKFDPGPAFPMQWLREALFPTTNPA
jgi:N-acetylmuramoyl-L-alanine amidase